MPANAEISSGSWVDSTAGIMVPFFASSKTDSGAERSYVSGPLWICTEIRRRAGGAPSSAIVHIPLASQLDETAPSVALVGSVLEGIKIGTPAAVLGFAAASSGTSDPGTCVLVGVVVDITQDKDADEMVIEILDDRYLLEGAQVVGQFHIDGITGAAKYRQGWPCHMNPGGQPNCTLATVPGASVKMPVFCPRNFGLSDGETVPTVSDEDVGDGKKAMYWTPELALTYLRFAFSGAASSLVNSYPYYFQIPSRIEWPEAWASALSGGTGNSPTEAQNSAQDLGQRKGREMVLEGASLLAAINEVLKQAGPFALTVAPQSETSGAGTTFGSQLQIVQTKYYGEGIDIPSPTSGNAVDGLAGMNVVVSGSVNESGRATYTRVSGSGGLVMIEKRVASERGTSNDGTYGLKKAMDQTLEDALKAEVQASLRAASLGALGVALTAQAYFDVIVRKREYEKFAQAWRVTENSAVFDFQSGTTESGKPICQVGRPIGPHQLSSFLEGTEDKTYSKMQAYGSVYVEYSTNATTDSDGTWRLLAQADGLARDADGTIWIRGARAQNKGYTISETGGAGSQTVTLTTNAVRMNVAIPCDHRVEAAYQVAGNNAEGVEVFDDGDGNTARIDPDLVRLYHADASDLYQKHIRSSTSYPNPASSGGAAAGSASILRNDTGYLQEHLKRRLKELGRVHRQGRIVMPHLCFAYAPGVALKSIQNTTGADFPLRGIVTEVVFKADRDAKQLTELIFE